MTSPQKVQTKKDTMKRKQMHDEIRNKESVENANRNCRSQKAKYKQQNAFNKSNTFSTN